MGAPFLRVFDGDGQRDARPTLTSFVEGEWRRFHVDVKRLDAKTVRHYVESAAWWRKITGDPPLEMISREMWCDFVAALRRQAGRKSDTLCESSVYSRASDVKRLLNFARRFDVVKTLPDLPLPDAPDYERVDGDFSLAELHALWRHADALDSPSKAACGCAPRDWWRTLLVLAYYTELRRCALLELRFAQLLQPPAEQEQAAAPSGAWVSLAKRSRTKGRAQRLYVASTAMQQINRIRRPSAEILGLPHTVDWLGKLLKRWQQAAGIPEERQWGFHGFRRAGINAMANCALDLETVRLSAGHGDLRVTGTHYLTVSTKERLMAWQKEQLPSPIPPEGDGDQLMLF